MSLRSKLVSVHWLLAEQFGFNPLRALRSMRGIPRYLRGLHRFRKSYRGPLSCVPCLHDWYEEGGATRSEYFWQDLLVARKIFEASPQKHVDIGSRVDGFVTHVATFREIEVFDIRPLTTVIPGVVFKQADLMSDESIASYVSDSKGYCDSISCLHAIEHFGLGRYGDKIDPDGYVRGIRNIARLLKSGGKCYLSTPIGRQRVEFNANWIFSPSTIINAAHSNGLIFENLTVVNQEGDHQMVDSPDTLSALEGSDYNLGIFSFKKVVG